MVAFYNEIDPVAVAVLRHLIAEGVIAPGVVDGRSIKELTPDDLRGYDQIHLFAGAGLWSAAARLAGWPDDRPLWTASCPCQPFSQAGQGRGVDDPRHLWPDVARLIDGCRARGFGPPVIVGEQVAGKAGYDWFNGVRTDLAKQAYRSRVVDIPSCAVDAPHIRQRLYWVALEDTERARQQGQLREPRGFQSTGSGRQADQPQRRNEPDGTQAPGSAMGDAINPRLEGLTGDGDGEAGRSQQDRPASEADGGNLGDAAGSGRQQGQGASEAPRYGDKPAATYGRNGTYWSDHEWLVCHDGKARRTKPGLRLLVDGMPGRVALWRIAGNAIVAPLAAEVLKALLDVLPVEVRRAA